MTYYVPGGILNCTQSPTPGPTTVWFGVMSSNSCVYMDYGGWRPLKPQIGATYGYITAGQIP